MVCSLLLFPATPIDPGSQKPLRSLAGQTPISIGCALLAWCLLPSSNTEKEPADHEKPLLQSLDVWGIVLFAAFMGSAVLILDLGGQKIPWNHPLMLLITIFSCFSGIALFMNEWRREGNKLFPPELLLSPGLHTIFLGQTLFTCALVSVSICSRNKVPEIKQTY